MRKVLYGARMSIETLYNKHCEGAYMSQIEFKALISQLIGSKVAEFEVQSIFKELDQNSTGMIPKSRFLDWFGHEEQEKLFQVGIEDIIKPLKTFMYKKQLDSQKGKKAGVMTLQQQIDDLFKNYDKDGDQMMSANELNTALGEMLGFKMTGEEVETMKEFFRAKFRKDSIRKLEFKKLLDTENKRQWDMKTAKMALRQVKQQLTKVGKTIPNLFKDYLVEDFPNEVTLRGFKYGMNSLKVLTQQQINNLSKYLDRKNNGFI